MDVLRLVHDRLSITALLFMLACGIWGLWLSARNQGVSGSYWGALVIGEILFLVEGLLGVILFGGGLRPERAGVHILYGVVTVIALPAAFLSTRGRDNRYEALIYAIVALFLAGVTIRARITGGIG